MVIVAEHALTTQKQKIQQHVVRAQSPTVAASSCRGSSVRERQDIKTVIIEVSLLCHHHLATFGQVCRPHSARQFSTEITRQPTNNNGDDNNEEGGEEEEKEEMGASDKGAADATTTTTFDQAAGRIVRSTRIDDNDDNWSVHSRTRGSRRCCGRQVPLRDEWRDSETPRQTMTKGQRRTQQTTVTGAEWTAMAAEEGQHK